MTDIGTAWLLFAAQVATVVVLLDLHDSPGADTSGIAWLAQSTERFACAGGKLVLVTVPPSVEQIVTVLGLGELFHAARTDAEALAVVRNGHPEANGRATAGRADHHPGSD